MRRAGWILLVIASCGQCDLPTSGPRYDLEHRALVALYDATGGEAWFRNDGWLNTTVSHCLWFGVKCSTDGKVAKLKLIDNELTGTVPIELISLTELGALMLATPLRADPESQGLSGTVPAELASLTGLYGLALNGNRLSGTVPAELARRDLIFLELNANRLSGTVPAALSRLLSLDLLNLNMNHLSGTVPVELLSLSALTGFDLNKNHLSGTVPTALASLSRLLSLIWNGNRLSGTVPSELASLTGLNGLYLSNNRLSGTVPSELASLTAMELSLALATNSLSGSIPPELASLTGLNVLNLFKNRLSGTVPAALAQLNFLTAVDLIDNRLSGTVPSELASLSSIQKFTLYSNSISGTLPSELGRLSSLAWLGMSWNNLDGTIPPELASLTKLTWLGLTRNSLSGNIPSELTSLSQLITLRLQENRISGTIADSLPTSLQQLVLHKNSLDGVLPSFHSYSNLRLLTLFDNNLWGRLVLPKDAPELQIIVAHRNRLSCPVEFNASSYKLNDHGPQWSSGALIAPGNRFSTSAIPSWALTRDVTFLWVWESFWQEIRLHVLIGAVGVMGTMLVAGILLKSEWWSFFRFKPTGAYEELAWLCTRLLLGLSLIGLVSLLPVYVAGAGEFECGQQWLRATLSYLSGSQASELAASVLICGLLGVLAFVATSMRSWACAICTDLADPSPVAVLSWQRRLVIAVVWPVLVLLFSVPGFLATLAQSVPGDQNTVGLSKSLLDGITYAISPVLTFIDFVLLPTTARALVGGQSVRVAVALQLAARFLIIIVAPFMTALLFDSDCFGLWIKIWEPCQSAANFNMQYIVPGGARSAATGWNFAASNLTTGAVEHADVCEKPGFYYGRCPRAVIESVAGLVVGKQIFSASVSPLMTILLSLPWAVSAQKWAMRFLRRREYLRVVYLDAELVSLTMVMDEMLVLGLAVPAVMPLGCLVVGSRLLAVHLVTTRLGIQYSSGRTCLCPPPWYLAVSLLLGASLLVWFYVSNAELISGSLIVYIGVPTSLIGGIGASWAVHWRRLSELRCCQGGSETDVAIQLLHSKTDDCSDDYALFEDKHVHI